MLKSKQLLKRRFEALSQEVTNTFLIKGEPLRADFPRGYIRCLTDLRVRWPYLERERRRTIACVVQLCDIIKWNLHTWTIGLTAGSVWEWHCALPVITVMEALLNEFALQRKWTKKPNFHDSIDALAKQRVFSETFKQKLHGWREYRNEIHLHLKSRVEIHNGIPKKYNDAVKTLAELEEALINYWGIEDSG